jgi:hypothetical protein
MTDTTADPCREALAKAAELSRYAAAPFFGDRQRIRTDGEVSYVYRTTEEWWDGLRELIEAVQPMLAAAERALAQEPATSTEQEPIAFGIANTEGQIVDAMYLQDRYYTIPLYAAPQPPAASPPEPKTHSGDPLSADGKRPAAAGDGISEPASGGGQQ